MKELQSASKASINATNDDSAADADDDTSQSAANSKLLEKYSPVVAKFKVCICNILWWIPTETVKG